MLRKLFSGNCAVFEVLLKRQATDDNILRRMRNALWITKAKNTLMSKVSQNTTNLLSNYKCDDMFRLTESSSGQS